MRPPSLSYYVLLLESLPDAIVVVNQEGRIVLINSQAEELFGYTREELVGESIELLMPERFRDRHCEQRAGYVAAPRLRMMRMGLDIYGLRRDGSEFPADISLNPLETEEGMLVCAAIRDITERKQVEESLRARAAELHLITEQIPAVLWTTDLELRITSVHGATLKQFGAEPSEVLGQTLEKLLDGDEVGAYAIEAHRRALRGESVAYERRYRDRDYDVRIEPLRNEQGHIVGCLRLALDVTERKRMEEALEQARLREQQEREIRFDAIVRSMGEGVLVVKEDGLIHFVNNSAQRLLNQPADALLEQPVLTVIGEDSWREFFQPLVVNGKKWRRGEITLPLADRPRYINVHAEAVELPDGNRAGFVCVLMDVTTFREMDQLKSKLVSFVSHELRQPITAVKGYASMLRRYDVERIKQYDDEFPQKIDRAADRLKHLVDTFLDISKIDAGCSIELAPKTFDVREMVTEAIEIETADVRRCTFEAYYGDGVSPIYADRDKLLMVLINLLSNAEKYSPQGSEVLVCVTADEVDTRFAVIDHGRGIPPEAMQNLFTPFYRVPESAGKKSVGTGLGLYLCKYLVEAHRGKIEVQSEPGRGTTVCFTIPTSNGV